MDRRLLAASILFSLAAGAQEPDDLAGLEQLMKQEVFSVGKKPQRLDEAAAAVYVISNEDIRRSGVTSIVEALRLAPGVLVSRMNGNVWSVSIRGFSTLQSDKLLVLMDGRTLYTPLYAGVYWDSIDTPLEDIERIEVVRGPQAATWGTNAVNGVINIITKRPEATQGSMASVTSGTEDWLVARYRYGARIRSGTNYRIYGSQTYRIQPGVESRGFSQQSWRSVQGGFRLDHSISDTTAVAVQGDLFRVQGITPQQLGGTESYGVQIGSYGGNFLGRWNHIDRWGGETTVQSYFDSNRRGASLLASLVNTLDTEVQYRRRLWTRHELQLVAGARRVSDKTEPSFGLAFDPSNAAYNSFGLAAVDEITVLPDKLLVTVGTRADRLWLGGWSVQPTGRISWMPTRKRSVWAAVSRATRVLTRQDADFHSTIALPGLPPILSVGNEAMRPESGLSYEAGFRNRFSNRLALDVTGFRASYKDLIDVPDVIQSIDFQSPLPDFILSQRANFWKGYSYGAEAAVTAEITDRWSVTGSFSSLKLRLRHASNPWGTDTSNPRYLWQVRSHSELTRRWQANVALYGTAERTYTPYTQGLYTGPYSAPGRLRVDANLGWTLSEVADLSFGVRDTLKPTAMEYDSILVIRSSGVRRNAFVTLRWRF